MEAVLPDPVMLPDGPPDDLPDDLLPDDLLPDDLTDCPLGGPTHDPPAKLCTLGGPTHGPLAKLTGKEIKALTPAVLPNPFALKSHKNHRYLKCVNSPYINRNGVLQFCEKFCAPNFRTKNARIPGYVHIKYVANGKYLKRATKRGWPVMIVATANSPNEDTRDEGCTLFKPEDVGPNNHKTVVCRIIHVQSGLFIRPCCVKGEDAIFYAVNPNRYPDGVVDLFSATGKN